MKKKDFFHTFINNKKNTKELIKRIEKGEPLRKIREEYHEEQ